MRHMGSHHTDVLIVGAGPTGLTLAAQLHALGATVRIVDRGTDRAHESRALAVQPRTLEVLAQLGLAATLVERGRRGVRVRLHLGRRVVELPLFDIGIPDTAYPFLLFVSQAETERVLVEHLAAGGIRVERAVELAGFRTEDGMVAGTLRHADGSVEAAQARWLAGCDGARSTVRHLAGIPFEGGTYPQTFALGDLEVDGLEPDAVHAFLTATGILFFFPLGSPASWRLLAMRPTAAGNHAAEPDAPSLADLQAIADGYTGGRLRLHDPAWLTWFRLHHRHAARYRAGPVRLAGDAAHVHSPAGGQGMNTGIQDAWNLGWKLALVARGIADPALLDSYEQERRPVGGFVVRYTDRLFAVATAANPLLRLLRAQLAPRVARLALRPARLRALGFRTLSQLAVNYRHSPAVHEGEPAPRRGPRAGDRLPDARLADDGRACTLHDALRPPGFHLLLCGPPGGWDERRVARLQGRDRGVLVVHRLAVQAAPGVLHDVAGEAFARLGVDRTAQYLARPDGHVGYRCAGTDLAGLERYLARWLHGPSAAPHRAD
jgi:2-polyprenyl-6-methoxyphenol hydroxylase-like FAD-dependent oxidoreductase